MKRPFSVTLCGYYGFGNVGDELLASSIIRLLQETGIEKNHIAVLSNDPDNTARSLGTASADRWKPKEVFSILRKSRTLLLGGGGLFQDTTSVRSCLYYWGVIRLARLAGTVPWMFGQSVGPFRTGAGKFLARNAIGKCRARAVRDEGSRRILAGWGYDMEVTPDPVLYLGEDQKNSRTSSMRDNILINVRPWQGELPHIFLSELVRLKRDQNCPLRFIALSGDDQEFLEENLHRSVRHIVLVAFLFQCFDLGGDLAAVESVGTQLDSQLLGFVYDITLATQIGYQHPPFVPHKGRVHMLIGARDFHDGIDVQAAFVGESASADKRPRVERYDIGRFTDETGQTLYLFEAIFGNGMHSHF